MLELAERLLPILRSGAKVAAVSVSRVLHSAPHGVGATMAVTENGVIVGSISGGCVEGDSVILGMSVLGDGVAQGARFGFDDAAAHSAGLACGGSIEVIAYRVGAEHVALLERAARGEPITIGVVASGPERGTIIAEPAVYAPAAAARRANLLALAAYTASTEPRDLLLLSRAPRPRLIILGAGEHGAALCRLATAAGYAVTVCDPWAPLATASRFPDADRLVTAFPDQYLSSLGEEDIDARTAICVLTHDERLDIPALRVALGMPVGFVGAMGARSTVARRASLLMAEAVSEADLGRLHSPLGLDLGGSTPEETAISILAEITAARHGGTGLPLTGSSKPMHRSLDGGTAAGPSIQSCSVPREGDDPRLGIATSPGSPR
ncbi:XdhC family protein [Paenarthrobacter nitroguajacolicus]|uniref:XdhC family protein n=1 Tax=Paenarthrobacter nitroguajacolicus TaxID=211146 RepID=UPI00248C99A3|nr:XdhC/CoxI family protein [Paenarthrobacter nitroguajacolicus]MDI2035635.1 putative xanthine dehydrogenase subunit A [Paenarthrobacter nitroguajacolicus]